MIKIALKPLNDCRFTSTMFNFDLFSLVDIKNKWATRHRTPHYQLFPIVSVISIFKSLRTLLRTLNSRCKYYALLYF